MDLREAGALLVLAGLFLAGGYGAWQLRRLRRHGLDAAAPRPVAAGGWQLGWPTGWETPRADGRGFVAATFDHDGRVELQPLFGPAAAAAPEPCLRAFLQQRQVQLDDWLLEDDAGAHGRFHSVEGRGRRDQARGYFWLARVPGPQPDRALLLFYHASVLYGLADGFWLHQIAARARLAGETETGASDGAR